MRTSPGEQTTPRSGSKLLLLVLLALVLVALWARNTRYPPIREYRLFLSEERRHADLPWELLSESWSEADFQRQFSGYPVRCGPDHTGTPGVTRSCSVDLKALNGVPTMYANFLFADGKLHRVAGVTPWWSHASGLEALQINYGKPHVTQVTARSGVRLHGWKLENGAFLFYNRDRDLNPLEPNSTQWFSPTACAPRACIE